MPVVQIVCPKCGGDVELEDSREFGFCMYCGTKIMISEMITQKVRIDESHKVDSWLSFCESDMSTRDYDSLEKHAEKILENDKDNSVGWYYKGAAQIGKGKFESGYESWIKCVNNCHDGKYLMDFFKKIPDFVYTSTYLLNQEWSCKPNDEQTEFNFASPGGITDLDTAFNGNDDFVIDENDESCMDLIFSLFDKFKECFEKKQSLRMYYGMYEALVELVNEIVWTYIDPEILLETFEESSEMGRTIIGKVNRPNDDYDLSGAVRWDSIETDKEFYSIVLKKMKLYLEDYTEEDVNNVIKYWQEREPDYIEYYDEASVNTLKLRDPRALVRLDAKSKTKKLAEAYVDAFLGPVMTKKKTGLFGRFKK